jgi:hypothetical protein
LAKRNRAELFFLIWSCVELYQTGSYSLPCLLTPCLFKFIYQSIYYLVFFSHNKSANNSHEFSYKQTGCIETTKDAVYIELAMTPCDWVYSLPLPLLWILWMLKFCWITITVYCLFASFDSCCIVSYELAIVTCHASIQCICDFSVGILHY